MDLRNLEPPIKTNNKVPGKLGIRIIEEFITLSPKTYSFKDYPNKTKEKGIKNCNNAKHEEYYNALECSVIGTLTRLRVILTSEFLWFNLENKNIWT